jgi:hypothetical protein
MSCCRSRIPACPNDSCLRCSVPASTFPDQSTDASQGAVLQQCLSANGVLSSTSSVLQHDQPVLLVGGTYYAFNGAEFLMLGSQQLLTFTATPAFSLSEVFYFRVKKYPITGIDIAPDGTVPYQSAGPVIREGDLVMLESPVAQSVLYTRGPPSPYNLPYFGPSTVQAIEEFQRFGTQSGATMRIISDSYDASIPRQEQPAVAIDGAKAYFFQFTRTGQALSVLPGATPAPCAVKTSAMLGDTNGTRIIPLSASTFYQVPPASQVAAQIVLPVQPAGALRLRLRRPMRRALPRTRALLRRQRRATMPRQPTLRRCKRLRRPMPPRRRRLHRHSRLPMQCCRPQTAMRRARRAPALQSMRRSMPPIARRRRSVRL